MVELCNGEDDDCDGDIDEELGLGERCSIGRGNCVDGVKACAEDGTVRCDAILPGVNETCNGEMMIATEKSTGT